MLLWKIFSMVLTPHTIGLSLGSWRTKIWFANKQEMIAFLHFYNGCKKMNYLFNRQTPYKFWAISPEGNFPIIERFNISYRKLQEVLLLSESFDSRFSFEKHFCLPQGKHSFTVFSFFSLLQEVSFCFSPPNNIKIYEYK